MPEQVVAQSKAILRWKGQKRGKTMFSAKAGTLVLTNERLLYLSTGVNPLLGSSNTSASIAEGLAKKGSLEIPLQRITSCELATMWGLLVVGYADDSGAESWTTFGEQVGGLPDGPAWVEAINQARRVS